MKVISDLDLAHKADEGLETPVFAKPPRTIEHSPASPTRDSPKGPDPA